jgi:predicted nucleotide-binding protein
MNTNQVFIVHGHDAIRHEVARFVRRIGCEEIILEEQVDAGVTTIFEKFTRHAAQATYAIVLMTPEDLTKDVASGKEAARARQNVILELGFFIGKLGAKNVCLAKKGEVDIPSDIHGILYINLDDGGWQLKLAKKLKAAGLNVDLNQV